ncbi:MAG: hypothetical protein ACYSUT_11255, partial [Planctomycetota bacterium]
KVSSFGLSDEQAGRYERIRNQAQVLYYHWNENSATAEFAVDLCKFSDPYQIILACVSPQQTLDRTMEDVQKKIAGSPDEKYYRTLSLSENLLVPNMFWDIEHHYAELEGKSLGNEKYTEYFLSQAFQNIQFRLDRYGAELKSEAVLKAEAAVSRNFEFNRPFLIIIKKRGTEQPFFVMWVANAELLSPYESSSDQ